MRSSSAILPRSKSGSDSVGRRRVRAFSLESPTRRQARVRATDAVDAFTMRRAARKLTERALRSELVLDEFFSVFVFSRFDFVYFRIETDVLFLFFYKIGR